MKKKVYLFTQSKGTMGKSLGSFILAERYPNAVILDLDEATKTSKVHLAYRNPIPVSFLDEHTQRIDRGAFNTLIESISIYNAEMFIADAGSTVSEILPRYLDATGADTVAELLASSEIQLNLICIIGGGNVFRATMLYLEELEKACKGKLSITVLYNAHYPFADNQKDFFHKFITDKKLKWKTFSSLSNASETAARTVDAIIRSGKGLSGCTPFQLIYFKQALLEFKL